MAAFLNSADRYTLYDLALLTRADRPQPCAVRDPPCAISSWEAASTVVNLPPNTTGATMVLAAGHFVCTQQGPQQYVFDRNVIAVHAGDMDDIAPALVVAFRDSANALMAGIHILCERLYIFPLVPSELHSRRLNEWMERYDFRHPAKGRPAGWVAPAAVLTLDGEQFDAVAPAPLAAPAAPVDAVGLADVLQAVNSVHADVRRLLPAEVSPQPHDGNALVLAANNAMMDIGEI
ncbi:hypothetical protein N0V85_009433 [Neurospora sp. IMI 360204]|nr:hypothetical protein N0V85_009433 [Neurospora sp. IMI 360204]